CVGPVLRRRQDDHRLLDRLIHHGHILETGNDSFRSKNSSTQLTATKTEKAPGLLKGYGRHKHGYAAASEGRRDRCRMRIRMNMSGACSGSGCGSRSKSLSWG